MHRTTKKEARPFDCLVPITFHGDAIQYAALGESVVVKCNVQASPAAEVSWFKGRERTRIGAWRQFLLPSSRCARFPQRVRNTLVWTMASVFSVSKCRIMKPSGVEQTCWKRANHEISPLLWSFLVRWKRTRIECHRWFDSFLLESVTQPRITCATPCAIEKKTATLVCESTGLPPPKYSWYYGSVSCPWRLFSSEMKTTKKKEQTSWKEAYVS